MKKSKLYGSRLIEDNKLTITPELVTLESTDNVTNLTFDRGNILDAASIKLYLAATSDDLTTKYNTLNENVTTNSNDIITINTLLTTTAESINSINANITTINNSLVDYGIALEYVDNKLILKNKNSDTLSSIDLSAMTEDTYLDTVTFSNNKLIFTWNEGSSKKPITIDLSRLKDKDGNELSVGNILAKSKLLFLSKNDSDTAKGLITFMKGVRIGNYTSESGGIIDVDLITGLTYLEVDKLKVRMKAYFETLSIINELSIAGKWTISPGGSILCTRVNITAELNYKCYFTNILDNVQIENKFAVNDLAISKDFNIKTVEYQSATNHYYWRKVLEVGEDYIVLSNTDCDTGSDAPNVGDVICQLGNTTDADRLNALVFSSVDETSPCVNLYSGINTYSLANKEYVSYGVNKTTNKAFMNVYGDMYFGDRPTVDNLYEGTSYIKYDSANKKVTIKGELDVKSTVGGTKIDLYIKNNSLSETDVNSLVNNSTVIKDMLNLIDGAIETYFYTGVPTLSNLPTSGWVEVATETNKETYANHVGDLYYDKDTGKAYRFMKDGNTGIYSWITITDIDITKALKDSSEALLTANVKKRIFYGTPTPPYDKGDLWVEATYPVGATKTDAVNNEYYSEILYCNTAKALGSSFAITDWRLSNNYTKTIGTVITDLDGYKYIKDALLNDTETSGGLILSSLIALRDSSNDILSGINGTLNPEATGKGIATWWGGKMIDGGFAPSHITTTVTDYATSLIRFDGSGYLANGNISWDTTGKVHADPTSFFVGSTNISIIASLFSTIPTDATSYSQVTKIHPTKPFDTLTADTIAAPTFIGELQGNAASATKLKTARTIWGQSFDGSGNVDGTLYTTNGLIVGEQTYSLDGIPVHGVIMGHTKYDKWNFGEYGGQYNFYLSNLTTNASLIARIDTNYNYLSGSLGIGTTSPAYKLDVSGAIRSSSSIIGAVFQIGTNKFTITDSGTWRQIQSYGGAPLSINPLGNNVGIGTTTPQYKLDVNGTLHAAGAVTLSSTLTAGGLITANGGTHTTALTATALSTLAATNILGDAQLSARVMSPDYVSQTKGWGITRAGAADFRNLYADELRVQAFTADISQALAGSDYLTKSVSKLSANFVVPAVNSTVRIIVDDIEGMPATQCFTNGDYIRFRAFNRTSGLTIANVWGTVVLDTTFGTNGFLNGTQAYTFTCKATSGAGLTVFKGSEVLDYGTSGSGLIARTTLDAMGSPYEQIATWKNDPSNGNNYTVHARLGNLNGIANCSGYGLYTDNGFFTGKIIIGDLTKSGNYLSFDNVNGLQIKLGGTSVATTTDVNNSLTTANTNAQGYANTAYNNAVNAAATNAAKLYVSSLLYQQDIAALLSQIDGSIETWFYEYIPTSDNAPTNTWVTDTIRNTHLGDLFYNTLTGYCYRYQLSDSVYSWAVITDTDVTTALANAAKAQDTADHKRRIFVTTPIVPYDVGDMWAQGSNGDILVCETAKIVGLTYNASDWVSAAKYTDDTLASEAKSDAEAAQSDATNALNNIASIISDNILDSSEKPSQRLAWNTISAEKANIDSNADIFGVSRTDYDNAFQTLADYLNSGITYTTGIPTWLSDINLSSNIIIVGSTYRTNWENYYTKRTLLLNSIALKTKTLADSAQNSADEAQTTANTAAHELSDYKSVMITTINELQSQIDGEVDSWFNQVDPTISNTPASEWTTDILKQRHANDTYTNTNTGASWKWILTNNVWGWTPIADTATQKALANAAKAQDTADGKRRVFTAQPTDASVYDVGDVWVNATYGTYKNDFLVCIIAKSTGAAFNIAHWKVASKYTDDTAANAAQLTANTAADSATKALDHITDLVSDNILSAVEKPAQFTEWQQAVSDKSLYDSEAITYNISTEKTDYDDAFIALAKYLNGDTTWTSGTTPLWFQDLSTNTTIVGDTYRSTWLSYYEKRGILLNKITAQAKAIAESNAAKDATNKTNNAIGASKTYTDGQFKVASDLISSKVSQTDFNTLGSRVGTAESNITLNANSIATKVSQIDFNALGQRVGTAESNITANSNSISSQVTSINDLTGRVSTAEAKITSDAINLTVKDQVDTAYSNAVTYTNSQITATNNSITAAVNGIQIADRNLLKNSYLSIYRVVYTPSNYTWTGVITPSGDKYWRWDLHSLLNEQYIGKITISFIAKSTVAGQMYVRPSWKYTQVANLTQTETYYSFTFDIDFLNYGDWGGFEFAESLRGATVTVKEIMISKGNIALPYRPAIEDVDANIATAQSTAISTAATNAALLYVTQSAYNSQVTILQDNINAKVSQTDFNALGTRVGTAESTITQHATDIASKVAQTDYTGNTIASLINQTATNVTIQANKINLVGAVTIGAIDKNSVTPAALGAATPTDVTTAVNGIQIGGRNLARNSKGDFTYNLTDMSNYTANMCKAYWVGNKNTNVVVSGDVEYSNIVFTGTGDALFLIQGTEDIDGWNNNNIYQYVTDKIHSGNGSFHFSFALTSPSIVNNNFWNFGFRSDYITGTVTFRNLKVEYGTKETSWTPAPEDVAQDAQNKVDELSRAHGGLTYLDDHSIYTGTLTANQVNAVGIDAGSITVGILNADRIGANAITADKLATNVLSVGNISGLGNLATQNSLAYDSSYITNKPNSLSAINPTEGTKLGGIAAGATVGATWGTNVAKIPTNLSSLNGTEGIKNTLIKISENGTLSGAGGGQVTVSGIGACTPTQAQHYANTSQTSAQDNLATKLGYTNYSDLVTKASSKDFGTLAVGGYLNTALIQAQAISTNMLATDSVTADKIDTNSVSAEIAKVISLDANRITTGKLSADRIDVVDVVANGIAAQTIEAQGATIRNLNVVNATVSGYFHAEYSGGAFVRMGGLTSSKILDIRADGLTGIRIGVYGDNSTGLSITANGNSSNALNIHGSSYLISRQFSVPEGTWINGLSLCRVTITSGGDLGSGSLGWYQDNGYYMPNFIVSKASSTILVNIPSDMPDGAVLIFRNAGGGTLNVSSRNFADKFQWGAQWDDWHKPYAPVAPGVLNILVYDKSSHTWYAHGIA